MTHHLELLIVGDGPVAEAVRSIAATLDWGVTTALTSKECTAALASADAVVVVSHHEGIDAPAIRDALRADSTYVGAMGSRKTQARRREWLLADGVTDEELGRLHAPIGLDIGADEPAEIAVAILAEIIAVRRGVTASEAGPGSLNERSGPIHPGLEPGEALCPGG